MKEKKKETIIKEGLKKVIQKVKDKNYDIGETQVFEQHSKKVSMEVVYFFIDYLKSKKYQFCVAPYEADAQLQYLYKSKLIDYIYSEDSDMIIYGCKHIVRSLQRNEFCNVFDPEIFERRKKMLNQQRKIDSKIENAIYFYELSKKDKIKVGIMSGCDFVSNIKTLGFCKIINFFDNTYDEDKQIKAYYEQQMAKKQQDILPHGIKSIEQYLVLIKLVELSFQHQLVFKWGKQISLEMLCKMKKKPKTKIKKYAYNLEDFIGDEKVYKSVDLKQFKEGNLDFFTFKQREKTKYDYQKAFEFIQLQPRIKCGLLNNLSVDNFGYNNFQSFFDIDKNRVFQDKESQDNSEAEPINNQLKNLILISNYPLLQ